MLGHSHILPPRAHTDFEDCNPLMNMLYFTPGRAKHCWYLLHLPPTASHPGGHRALCHHSSTGRGEIPQLHAGLESCCGTGLCRVPPLPLHHLPAPPRWVLLLHGGCSVVWRGSGPTPPTPAAPSPIKGPGSGCVGSRAPDTADGVCKVRLPQVCLPWPGLKSVQLEL